jgi:hypothetical protein
MESEIHPLAPHHLPVFATAPGETDTLLVVMGIVLALLIMFIGLLYFRLHALPEHLSHRNPNKMQFEIVAVLALLALFTHNTNFWFAALILSMIRFPDYETPLRTIAGALTGSRKKGKGVPDTVPDEHFNDVDQSQSAETSDSEVNSKAQATSPKPKRREQGV